MVERFLLVFAGILVLGAAPSHAANSLIVQADDHGVRVETPDMQATASRVLYDEVQGTLVLEGSVDSRVVLSQTRNGKVVQTQATRIVVWLKEGKLRGDDVRITKKAKRTDVD